jgi:hypothetical protein
MTWTQQRQLVKSLSGRVVEKKRDARRAHDDMKGWMSSYLGSLETLTWLFAVGSFLAAGRSSTAESGATRRALVAAINTSLFAWQLVNRQVVIARPSADQPSEGQR